MCLSLSGCLAERPPAGHLSLQREGEDIRIAFCDAVQVDELWVDQWQDRRQEVWVASPFVRIEAGGVLDRATLGDSLEEIAEFDFDKSRSILVQVLDSKTSREAEFPLANGVPTEGWLHPDGSITDQACVQNQ
ncbi:hypothetical protein [Protaetiibacter larvae]|uniref:Uncharacterized protein n=1 Tax=Protaetiibacter larvae TaxID=2592654 RepID=A0A5C1Y6V7_9MICO|nr:hypothetical protein [Protaetiibacter larvae]QEO08597.1 hypothetical protein FLP23_00260 [Protaetiibacter larvae]